MEREIIETYNMIISELFALVIAIIFYAVLGQKWVFAIITSIILLIVYIITKKQINEIKAKVLE